MRRSIGRVQRMTGTWLVGAATLMMVLIATGCEDPDGARTVRLAHVYEPNAPTHACGVVPMAEAINAADVGLRVQTFPASQLGSESELVEQLQAGNLEMAIAGPSFLATWHEPIGAFDAAYAFRNVDHMMEVMEGEIGWELWDQLREERGVRVLGTWWYGTRHITADRPIRHPDDFSGVQLRMPDARIWQATAEAMGARPMPIPFDEVYLALAQGVADGQENPLPTIEAMRFNEVQDYLNLTGHIESSTQMLVNDDLWQSLTDEQREVVEQAVHDAAVSVRECIEESDERLLAEWGESGELQIIDEVDLEAFRERARRHFEDGWVFSELYLDILELGEAE